MSRSKRLSSGDSLPSLTSGAILSRLPRTDHPNSRNAILFAASVMIPISFGCGFPPMVFLIERYTEDSTAAHAERLWCCHAHPRPCADARWSLAGVNAHLFLSRSNASRPYADSTKAASSSARTTRSKLNVFSRPNNARKRRPADRIFRAGYCNRKERACPVRQGSPSEPRQGCHSACRSRGIGVQN